MRAVWLVGALVLCGCSAATPSVAPPAPAQVACYDAARKLVTRSAPTDCTGEIIDDRRAAAIAAERAERTRAMLQTPLPRPGQRQVGSGTGFFVEDGTILTDRHVVASCGAITVEPADGQGRPVHLVAADEPNDLALLHGDVAAPAIAAFNPQPSRAALINLMLVGFPERAPVATATPVFVPRAAALDTVDQYLFHGDVHHGHSGGPIIDPSGRVIGIIRGMVDTARTYQTTGKVITEVGLAIANHSALGFLAANDVRYSTAAMASHGDLLAQARRFLVHVRCWR